MLFSKARASSAANTGVLPVLTICLGPRMAAAGLVGITCPTTSQSKSWRKPARFCLTVAAAYVRVSSSM